MNLFTGDLDKITINDVEDFLAIAGPEEQRPSEGLRIDYKEKEPVDFPETVAAFSNTAGGLLFIGVETKKNKKKKYNIPIALPGEVFAGGDVRARVAGKILSQATPRPETSIGIAWVPPKRDSAVVVVRVTPGHWPPYEFTMLDRIRIPVRIQDTNRQATLREIEEMLRRRESFAETTETRVAAMKEEKPLVPSYVSHTLPDDTEDNESTQAYQTWIIRPRVSLRLRLDRSFEKQVSDSFSAAFIDANIGQFWPPFILADSHVLRWQARISGSGTHVTCARRLEFTAEGSLRYSEKIDRHVHPYDESVSDLLIQSLRFLRFAAEFYQGREYFGGLSKKAAFLTPFPMSLGKTATQV
jgi:hypothetical protein